MVYQLSQKTFYHGLDGLLEYLFSRSTGTRILAGSWFFFCLIIVSSYTANLAAFLTIESPIKVIRGIDDLYNQTKIKYGFKANGSTYQYFKVNHFMIILLIQFEVQQKN